MKAYVVFEEGTAGPLLRAVPPPDFLEEVGLVESGRRSNLLSVARTLLSARQKPVAVLRETLSVDERAIHERIQLAEELLDLSAGGVPKRVIPLIPEIEVVFFQV